MKIKEVQQVTTCIKHLAVSGLSSGIARIKSSCNLIGNRFEMPNVSYTQPLAVIIYRLDKTFMIMEEVDFIKTFKRRKMDFGDYLHLLITFLSITPLVFFTLIIISDFKENGQFDWSSILFFGGIGILLPIIIYRTFMRSIYFKECINKNSKETNLEIVLNILKIDLDIKKIQVEDKLVIADSKISFASFGEHITILVDDKKILYNCWSKVSFWSIDASKIYSTFDEKLKE